MKYLDTLETLLIEHGKLEAILESSSNGIMELDGSGNILSCNPAARGIFNLRAEEAAGADVGTLLHSPEIAAIIRSLSGGNEEIVKRELHVPVQISPDRRANKFLELKFITIPRHTEKFLILIITDKTDIMRALENREHFISILFDLIEELKVDNRDIIYNLARLVEIRDARTGQHLERVEAYTRILASEYQKYYKETDPRITDEYVEDMALSSVLHDIGKIGISDSILQKPGKLEPDEFKLIQEHTVIAGEALVKHRGKKDYLAMGREISLSHHEKWNGTGYPRGLKGEDIPLSGRIVALSDVYDALTSERPYKEAFTHEKAVEIITEERGQSFDPRIVDLFLNIHPQFNLVREKHRE